MNVPFVPDSFLVHWLATAWNFLNSNFFMALSASALGAFAGAYVAQNIAKRQAYRDELLKEMRNTNAASNVAFSICNTLLGVKKQHVKRLKEDFDSSKANCIDHHRRIRAGEIPRGTVLEFRADLQTLSLPELPIDILLKQVFEQLSLVGRPLVLTTTLNQTVHSLGASFEKRNELIATFKQAGPELPVHLYFGLRQGDVVDESYPSAINAIHQLTNDAIFFSWRLNKDLTTHCENLATQFKKEFSKKGAPTVSMSDFSEADQSGLMPNVADYVDWDTKFRKADELSSKPEPSSRWKTTWTSIKAKYAKKKSA